MVVRLSACLNAIVSMHAEFLRSQAIWRFNFVCFIPLPANLSIVNVAIQKNVS